MIDYAKHDKGINYYNQRLEMAHRLKFNYVTEAWHYFHSEGVSDSAIGRMFGVTKSCINYNLKQMGVQKYVVWVRKKSVLSEKQVLEIASSEKTVSELYNSGKYPVSKTAIFDIKNGRSWGSVTGIKKGLSGHKERDRGKNGRFV